MEKQTSPKNIAICFVHKDQLWAQEIKNIFVRYQRTTSLFDIDKAPSLSVGWNNFDLIISIWSESFFAARQSEEIIEQFANLVDRNDDFRKRIIAVIVSKCRIDDPLAKPIEAYNIDAAADINDIQKELRRLFIRFGLPEYSSINLNLPVNTDSDFYRAVCDLLELNHNICIEDSKEIHQLRLIELDIKFVAETILNMNVVITSELKDIWDQVKIVSAIQHQKEQNNSISVVVSEHISQNQKDFFQHHAVKALSYFDLLSYYFSKEFIDRVKQFFRLKKEDLFVEPYIINDQSQRSNALNFLTSWIRNKNNNFLLLLGDLGTGKTTLALNFSEILLNNFINHPATNSIPVYIALDHTMMLDSFEIIIQKHFKNMGVHLELIQLHFFMSLFNKGYFTIIFDGFDILADGMNWETLKNCFQKFRPHNDSKGKLILTCRTHYFRSINEQNDMISSGEITKLGVLAEKDYRAQVIYLQEFSEKQILEYLKQDGRESDYNKLKEIYNFSDMSKRPLLLKLILKYMNKLEGKHYPATIVELYKIYINAWLERDEVNTDRQIMNQETKKALMIELAWEMWNTGQWQIHYESLTNFLKKQYPDKELKERKLEQVLRNTMRASFLKRDENGSFSFVHQSFMEYFVALNIYESAFLQNSHLSKLLQTKLFNSEINHFLSMLDYEKDHLVSSLNDILEQSYQEKISENALSILYHKARFNCGMHKAFDKAQAEQMILTTKEIFPEKITLSGAFLQNMDLRGAHLVKANLSNSDLSHTNLSYSNLEKANLTGCNLTEAMFEHANASKAQFREANIKEADFSNCQLHSCDFRGALNTSSANLSEAEGIDECHILEKLIFPVIQKGGHCRRVEISVISPDELLCASGGNDGLIFVYNNEDLRIRWVFEGHTGSIVCLQFSKDHKYLISGSSDKTVRLWSIEKGKIVHVFSDHTQAVTSVCFSPNEQIIASGSYDMTVRLWNAKTYDLIACFKDAKTYIQSVYFFESDDIISAMDIDQREYQWHIENRQLIAEESNAEPPKLLKTDPRLNNLPGHQSAINCVYFSTDGHYLVSAIMDKTVRIWNLETAKVEHVVKEHQGEVSSICVAPNENWFASASYDQTIKIWELSTGEHQRTLTGHSSRIYDISISRIQNRSILSSAGNNDQIILWDSSTGEIIGELKAPDRCRIITLDFSPDATILAAAGNTGKIYLWDLITRKLTHTLESHHSGITAISFSNDAKWLASASQDKTVRVWNMDAHENNHVFKGHDDEVLTVCFANTQPFVASGSRDNTVRIFNYQTQKCIAVLKNHMGRVLSVCFAPHDKYLIAAGEAGRLQFWDFRKEQVILYRYFFGQDAWLNLLPDGRFDGNDNGIRFLSYTEQDTLNSKRATELKNEYHRPDEVQDTFSRFL